MRSDIDIAYRVLCEVVKSTVTTTLGEVEYGSDDHFRFMDETLANLRAWRDSYPRGSSIRKDFADAYNRIARIRKRAESLSASDDQLL